MKNSLSMPMICGCVLLLAGCSPANGRSPSVPDDAAVGPDCSVLAFVPYWVQDQATASFEQNIDVIDYISVFWYNLGPDGKIRKYVMAEESRALIERAHAHGVKVLALVANLPDEERPGDGGTWDPTRVGRAISTEAARAAHIEDLMDLTRRMSFDGIYIDYEALPGAYRERFTLFIKELSEALHAEDKLLAVAIHPKTTEDNPLEDNGSAAQDLEELDAYADQLHFMTYSQHTAETPPGPVASVGWVERVLHHAVMSEQVPPAKVYMGVPLYAEEWRQTLSGRYRGLDNDIMFTDAQQRKHEHSGVEKWSAEHASPYIVYRDQQLRKHVIWFENRRSIAAKLALGDELGVCQLSLWRLGGEDPAFWDLVRERGASRQGGGQAPASAKPAGTVAGEDDEQGDGSDDSASADEGSDTNDSADDDGSDDDSSDEAAAEGDDENAEDDGGEDAEGSEDAEVEDGEDGEDSATFPEEGPETRRPWGLEHLELSGQTSASVEFYSAFATTDPASERENWLAYMDSSQQLALTSRLGLASDMRLVLESDGEDARFYTDFPHEGLYFRSLVLRYGTDRFAVFGGKYEPAVDIRGHAPIFFGNHSVDLRLDRRIGVGASVTLTHAGIGQHTLTGHAFHRDTTRLSGEVFTGRDRNHMYDGTLASTGKPDSHLLTLNGGTTGDSAGIAYTLGWGRQRNGDATALDEYIYLGALKGTVPLGRYGTLEPSLDVLSLHHAGGEPGDTRNLLLGLAYTGPALSLGGTCSLRFGNPPPEQRGRSDFIGEILARYEIGRGFSVEAAYQNIRQEGEQDNLFGIVFGYMREWLVD